MASKFRQGLALAIFAIPCAAQAAGWHDLNALDAEIAERLAADGIVAVPVDRRLKLAACPEPVAVDSPTGGAVAVRCIALGWRLRVPVTLVAGRSSAVTTGGAPGGTNMGAIVVRRGDPVALVSGASGFSVSGSGTVERDGRIGERIRVRVRPGAPFVMGELIDAGTVKID